MTGIVGKPEMRVELGFGSGATTAPGSISWTDVSAYVRQQDKISWSWGRTDERSDVGAGSASVTFNNVAGRFTAANTSGAYYPDIKMRTPLRISFKPPAGAWTVVWSGLVDSFTPMLANGIQPICKVDATDRLSRITRRILACWETEQTLVAGPSFLWPLTDAVGTMTTADVASGTTNFPLTLTQISTGGVADFQSGALPVDEGTVLALTPASSTSGWYFTGPVTVPGTFTGEGFSCLMNTISAVDSTLFRMTDIFGSYAELSITSAGKAKVTILSGFGGSWSVTSAASVNDAAWHQIGLTINAAGTAILYVDGANAGTVAGGGTLSGNRVTIAGTATGSLFSGQLSHVAIWADQTVDPAWMTDAYAAMTGAVETSDLRFTRICRWLGHTVTPNTGLSTMGMQNVVGRSGSDALNDVADAELGIYYTTADGTPALSVRNDRYNTPVTLTLTADEIGADADFAISDVDLINKSAVKRPTGATYTHVTQSSIDQYDEHSESLELFLSDEIQPAAIAQWRGTIKAEPSPRVESLEIDGWAKQSTIDPTVLLSVGVSSRLAITGLPSSAPSATLDLFVEGGEDTVDHLGWKRRLNTSDAAAGGFVWQLGDADYSQLGTTTRLAV